LFGCSRQAALRQHHHRGGAAIWRGQERIGRVEAVLSTIGVLPFDVPADAEYGNIRAELEAVGLPIGPTDLFIAAHARAVGVTLVTHNAAELRRVRGLTLDNWLA
jgi:tRNA(fMet)-specific endonuclease VapC